MDISACSVLRAPPSLPPSSWSRQTHSSCSCASHNLRRTLSKGCWAQSGPVAPGERGGGQARWAPRRSKCHTEREGATERTSEGRSSGRPQLAGLSIPIASILPSQSAVVSVRGGQQKKGEEINSDRPPATSMLLPLHSLFRLRAVFLSQSFEASVAQCTRECARTRRRMGGYDSGRDAKDVPAPASTGSALALALGPARPQLHRARRWHR